MTLQHRLDAYWSGRSRAYHLNQTSTPKALAERDLWAAAFRKLLPSPPVDVLDVGTGSGFLAHLLADEGHHVTGIDSSQGMLEQANLESASRLHAGLPHAAFHLADAVNPGEEFRGVDVVTSRYLLWTLRHPEQAIGRWIELVRAGGLILAADANHFPEGIHAEISVDSSHGPDAFNATYDAVADELPLAQATTVQPYIDLFRNSGLEDVTVVPLPEILEHHRSHGISPGHALVEPFIVMGRVRK